MRSNEATFRPLVPSFSSGMSNLTRLTITVGGYVSVIRMDVYGYTFQAHTIYGYEASAGLCIAKIRHGYHSS